MRKTLYTILGAHAARLYLFWLDVSIFYFRYGRNIKLAMLHILHIIFWILVFAFIFAKATEPITGTF